MGLSTSSLPPSLNSVTSWLPPVARRPSFPVARSSPLLDRVNFLAAYGRLLPLSAPSRAAWSPRHRWTYMVKLSDLLHNGTPFTSCWFDSHLLNRNPGPLNPFFLTGRQHFLCSLSNQFPALRGFQNGQRSSWSHVCSLSRWLASSSTRAPCAPGRAPFVASLDFCSCALRVPGCSSSRQPAVFGETFRGRAAY